MARRLRAEDIETTEEERRLAREQAEADSYGGTGSAIGGIAGGALGALGFLAGPAVGAATTGIGSTLGGLAGGAIGSNLGAQKGDAAAERLMAIERDRQKKLSQYELRQQALDELMGVR